MTMDHLVIAKVRTENQQMRGKSTGKAPARERASWPVKPRVTTFVEGGAEFAELRVPIRKGALEGLTVAEREVAILVAAGVNNGAIARARSTSSRTIANQIASIRAKLGAGTRYELAARLACPDGDDGRRDGPELEEGAPSGQRVIRVTSPPGRGRADRA
jgi:DNA-binding CsgD family transcriptional regulator